MSGKESVEEFLRRGGKVNKVQPGLSQWHVTGPPNMSRKRKEEWNKKKAKG